MGHPFFWNGVEDGSGQHFWEGRLEWKAFQKIRMVPQSGPSIVTVSGKACLTLTFTKSFILKSRELSSDFLPRHGTVEWQCYRDRMSRVSRFLCDLLSANAAKKTVCKIHSRRLQHQSFLKFKGEESYKKLLASCRPSPRLSTSTIHTLYVSSWLMPAPSKTTCSN